MELDPATELETVAGHLTVHVLNIVRRKPEGFQIRQTPVGLPKTRVPFYRFSISGLALLPFALCFKDVCIAQPDLGIVWILRQQRLIKLTGSLVLPYSAADNGCQIAISRPLRVLGKQFFHLGEGPVGLIGPVQQDCEVVAGTRKTGGQLEAILQQSLRLIIATHSHCHLRQHSHCRHIRWRGLEIGFE